jgi:hypothetical protein
MFGLESLMKKYVAWGSFKFPRATAAAAAESGSSSVRQNELFNTFVVAHDCVHVV